MFTSALNNRTFIVKVILALLLLAIVTACRSTTGQSEGAAPGIIVVNAPATGEVRRVLVAEGVRVDAGTPIIEIIVQTETQAPAPSPGESAESQAVRNYKAADAEIEAARAEVVRHEAEVQRLTPLVASGQASQAELDGERALYERAQQRLQRAQDAKKNAETGLLAARQPGQNQGGAPTPAAPRVQIVDARATSPGTVRVINARVGERVTSGQALATLSAD
jgi:multidrug efflux pump subunit AcrA (membrane-fusion protein)